LARIKSEHQRKETLERAHRSRGLQGIDRIKSAL
jgi:hypothetical protein